MFLAVQMLLHTHNYNRFDSSSTFAAYCEFSTPSESVTGIKGGNIIYPISDCNMRVSLNISYKCHSARQITQSLFPKKCRRRKPKMVV